MIKIILVEETVNMLIGLRRSKNISQEVLGQGICSEQQISKLENGEMPPDFFLLEVLMHRLGQTTDKLEILLSEKEFIEVKERDDVLDDLRCGRIEQAKAHLEKFLAAMEKGNPIRCMNANRMEGIYAYELGRYEEAEAALYKAAELTMGNFSTEITPFRYLEKGLLSELELENLIILSHVKQRLGKTKEAELLLEQVLAWVNKQITDEEQLAKAIPKIAVVYTEIYQDRKEQDFCVQLCERAVLLLRKHGMLQHMSLLLGFLSAACQKRGREEDARRFVVWKEAIEQVYEHFGLSVEMVNKLYFNSCVGQFYLLGEFIREERRAQGLSQENLIEGIYENPETLSRVEGGTKPHGRKLRLLFDKLGVEKRVYGGRVITSDYSLLELHSEFAILLAQKVYDKAEWTLETLRKKLDMNILENRQMVECFENLYRYRKGDISKAEALQKMQELLQLTYRMDSQRVPFEGEALLFNQKCNLLGRMGKYDTAISQQKKIIAFYERSHVPLKYHYRTVYLIIDNMTHNMCHRGYADDTYYWSLKSVKDRLLNGKGNAIHALFSNFIGLEMEKGSNRQLCETYTKWAYYFTDIFMKYYDQKYFMEYEKQHFDKNIEWY